MTVIVDRIIRKKRRNIAIVVTRKGIVEVRAPYHISLKAIRGFVNKNILWIQEKKEIINKRLGQIKPKRFIDGEEFLYEGNAYALLQTDNNVIQLANALHFPRKYLSVAKEHLTLWYKKMALKKATEYANYYANELGLKYKAIKVSNAERRWGSCSPTGSININWRLIMAPAQVLKYVVAHELLHLLVRNHSNLYWEKVQKVVPEYKKYEKWLHDNGHILVLL